MITTKQRTGRLRPAREYEVFAVAGLIGVAAFLLLIAALWVWPITPDGLFHLHRVAALRSALAAGVFYPRWFPEFAFGYGYPVLNFYAPAFYYPPALLTLAGVDVVWATRLTLAAIYALSGAAAYLAGRLWVRPLPALLGAIIYLAFPYRLYDLVVRGALPEFAAFLWLPLLAWAAGAAARAAREDASARHSIMQLALPTLMAAVASAGLIATHNLTALMAAIATGFLVLALVVIGRRRAGLWITGVALLGALLSAPHTLPALAETRWLGFMATSLGRGYATHWASWHDLWSWSPLYIYPNAADAVVPLPGWVALVLVAGLAVALTPWGRRRRAILLSGIVILAILIWLMTSTSVQLWDIAASVLGVIQFPWRWQALLAGATAAAAAVTADDLTNSSPSPRAAVLTTLLMA